MGGDRGPSVIIPGLMKVVTRRSDVRFLIYGRVDEVRPILENYPKVAAVSELIHCEISVRMDDKPSQALRHGRWKSSMWKAIEAVKAGQADACVSAGNTGALMALSMLALRKAPGVDRPAIAVMWPSRNPSGYNVVLDVGADIRADARDLLNYAIMGAAYARNGLAITRPRVGLLNVGTEEHKGRSQLHEAAELIEAAAPGSDFEYVGYVEGSDISGEKVDLIVTDGFTGNVALKTAEGTAMQVRDLLKEAFHFSPLSRIGALFALTSLRRLSKRIDPRRVNGGVFLGLNGTVVKSHGSADATGISAAIKLAFILAQNGFAEKLARRVASGAGPAQMSSKQEEAEAS